MKSALFLKATALAALGLLLAACADDTSSFPYNQLSPVPPPEAPYEMPPVPADPQTEIWRPGHWGYTGTDFYWVEGTMMLRPSNSAVWAPDRWDRREYGWAFVPGYWQ